MLTNVVSTVVEVEADSKEDAIDVALTEGVPGLMFLDHHYPDEGEWFVEDAGDDVWPLEGND